MAQIELTFGKVIRQHREKLKISQEELGQKANLHRTYISQIERGKKSPTLKAMMILASALETPLSNLIHDTEQLLQDETGND